ncbi:MAG: cytochrome C [Acidobacteria bacterium]|nr:MAG: cytochrome C [Acidobacteriota bacterium]
MSLNCINLSFILSVISAGLVAVHFRVENKPIGHSLLQETKKADTAVHKDRMMPDASAAYAPDWERPYPQYQPVGSQLLPFPDLRPGDITPTDLYRYGGSGRTSFSSVDDVGDFKEFYNRLSQQKPKVMERWKDYMELRYDFTRKGDPEVTMSRSKPVPVGPVTRLPNAIKSWEHLADLSPQEIRERDLFPEGFRPLAHPLQSTGHMLFPQMWTKQHPEHDRFDVSFDIPEEYLPEFPPPLFLTTRPDLGDVSRGREITQANFRELFDGILSPEQIEGLRLLVTKFPTSWFNHSKHRLTPEPVHGVACFDCHVNGHTNGAIELDPSTRPTLARVRLDTPSLRGNHNNLLFSLKRSIRSTDHFAEVEEYFEGDISLQLQIGGRQLDKVSTNRMGDFNSLVGLAPAPKLNRLGRLDRARATQSELRGEKLFFEKAGCGQCHPAPFYTDNSMHDLRVEEFHRGRAEGWVKTFSLRGIKDSPPYFHDGRLPTLEDTIEFFNVLFQIRLSSEEKRDLLSFLRCL